MGRRGGGQEEMNSSYWKTINRPGGQTRNDNDDLAFVTQGLMLPFGNAARSYAEQYGFSGDHGLWLCAAGTYRASGVAKAMNEGLILEIGY